MRFDARGRPMRPFTEVILLDGEGITHHADELPRHDRHGRTACGRLFDIGPCVNINGNYVPGMKEVDEPVSCFVCLGEVEQP